MPSLSPSAPLIERARQAAFQFSQKLPNFICQEFMSRFTQQGRGGEVPQDLVSAEIIYEDGEESYRNVKINNHPTDKRLQDIDGSLRPTGEFASTLWIFLILLRKRSSVPAVRLPFRASVPRFTTFQVRSENSHWRLSADSQTVTAAFAGSVWVDPNTAPFCASRCRPATYLQIS